MGSGDDYQAVVAVAGGTPVMRMHAATPFIWNEEQGKTWYTLNNTISQGSGTTQSYSLCVPAGDYTLQFWDVCGGGGSCSSGFGFNAGTPPATAYGSGWEVGDPSRVVSVTVGQETRVRLNQTKTNVPTWDNFYGTYATWSYGDCSGGQSCPGFATCYQGTCVDTGYDFHNCGTGGSACTGGTACCAGVCSDESSDNNNCDGCGVVCGPGTTCTSGVCTPNDGTCGVLTAEVGTDSPADPTNYQGIFAVANGTPDENTGPGVYWNVEKNKTWYTLASQIFTDPYLRYVYSACVPPGRYTLQMWNDGCVNNQGGCGTFDNGIPPNPVYVWEIGDATLSLPVTTGSVTAVNVINSLKHVPTYDNFYGAYALWSYGGCGTYCPPSGGCSSETCALGTTCLQGACHDTTHDILACGTAGSACPTGQLCCSSTCTDNGSDDNNCGECGIVCTGGQHCVTGQCQ
ncbi:MAG: hypothetical protein JST54_19620 [Deltaproteobacteria bacterium]|nr:hypothetical protein [Deltaproteobacteria bacterium]